MKTESLSLKRALFIFVLMASLLGFVSNGHPQSTWSFVTIPGLPSGATPMNLWTDQPGNLYVWAYTNAPDAFLFHWDGTSWSQVLNLSNHNVTMSKGHVFGTGPSDVFASAYDNTDNRLKMYHYDGISWEEQPLPVETNDCTELRGIVGEPGNVYAFMRKCSTWWTRILKYDGNEWQVDLSVQGEYGNDKCGVVPAYISQSEIYATVCWGHSLWDGSSWTWNKGFDFCDICDTWGMRDGGGILHLYTCGANNFSNGIRVWRFTEDFPGSMTGSWGSKYGTVFSDPPGTAHDLGKAYAIWGSGPDDIYVVGWRRIDSNDQNTADNGRVYHFNGTDWEQITAFGDIPSAFDVWGSGPDDVWITLSGGQLLHYGSEPAIDFEDFTPNDQGKRFGVHIDEKFGGLDWAYDTESKIYNWGSFTVQDSGAPEGNDSNGNSIPGAGGSDNWVKARAGALGKGAKITRCPGECFEFKSMKLFTQDHPAFIDEVTVTWRTCDAATTASADLILTDDMWVEVMAGDLDIESVLLRAMWFNGAPSNPNAAKFGLDDLEVSIVPEP